MKKAATIIGLLLMAGTMSFIHAQENADTVFIANDVPFTMKYVEGGSFKNRNGEAVELNSFYIGETEVTQELWEAVMGNNPSYWQEKKLKYMSVEFPDAPNSERPVERVSWNDCQEFIGKLNSLTNAKFRLPRMDEWEYAALGGKDGLTIDRANEIDLQETAWTCDNSKGKTQPVSYKDANELGLYDILGNVMEWCQDDRIETDMLYGSQVAYKVARGGSWQHCFSSVDIIKKMKTSKDPNHKEDCIGLRLVLTNPADLQGSEKEQTEKKQKTFGVLKKVGTGVVIVGLAVWWYFSKHKK